jgi:hypothetical protein
MMAAMATYIAEADSYAGFGSTGKYFGYFGLLAGAVGLTGWAMMHEHLPSLQRADTGGQLLTVAMTWIGGGLAAIMAVATLGSLMLSKNSRGTVTVDDLGVTRQIGERSRMLRWVEIEGFVVTPLQGGVTLIPRQGRRTVVIPRFLDDYRGCLEEIKARGVRLLPPDNAQVRRVDRKKMTWKQAILASVGILAFNFASDPHELHALRLVALAGCVGYFAWAMTDNPELEDYRWVRWFGCALLAGMLAWLVWRMTQTW